MRLSLHLYFWFLSVVRCSATPLRHNLAGDDIQGLRAQRYLINGAKMYIYKSPRSIIYTKPGGYQSALVDFFSLEPTNIRSMHRPDAIYEMTGQVGQHVLSLNTGEDIFPQIQITRFEPGKDPEYYYYTKVFWYIGESIEGVST